MQSERTVIQIARHCPVYRHVVEEHYVCLNADDSLLAEKSASDQIWFCERFKCFDYQIQFLPELYYYNLAAGWFHHMAEVLYWHYTYIYRAIREGHREIEWIDSAEKNLYESVNRETWRYSQMDEEAIIGQKIRNEWIFRERMEVLQAGLPFLSERGFHLLQSVLSIHLGEVIKEHALAFKTLLNYERPQRLRTVTSNARTRSFPLPARV